MQGRVWPKLTAVGRRAVDKLAAMSYSALKHVLSTFAM